MGAQFSADVLKLDPEKAVQHAVQKLQEGLGQLHRQGAVVGLSGGIDSSVSAALSVRAFGKERVLGLFMPERDSSDEALTLGKKLAEKLGIDSRLENIGPALNAIGCYERQLEAIRAVEPSYGEGWKCKLVLPAGLGAERLNVTRLVVESPSGEQKTHRMPAKSYAQMVAATNYKQRLRKVTEYYHADRLSYAVIGTPNRLEYDQGFFVKLGDGSADLKPIAHLYKTQVFQLAEHLGVPAEIRARPPTTDTFSLPQSQEEFYFALPYQKMDLCLYAKNHGISPEEAARGIGLTPAQVEWVYKDVDAKRRATKYLHAPPVLMEEVAEI